MPRIQSCSLSTIGTLLWKFDSRKYHQVYSSCSSNRRYENLNLISSTDTHAAVYDLTNQYMYVAFVGPETMQNRNAYQRPFTKLDMKSIFAEPKPTIQKTQL